MSTVKNLYLNAVRRISHAVGTDETRPNLCAIEVRVKDGRSELIAVDGHRMSCEDVNGEVKPRTLAFAGGSGKKRTRIRSEEAALSFLLEGPETGLAFPDVERVIPGDEPAVSGRINRKLLLEAAISVDAENRLEEERRRAPLALDAARAEVAYLSALIENRAQASDVNRRDVARSELARYDREAKSIDGVFLEVEEYAVLSPTFRSDFRARVSLEDPSGKKRRNVRACFRADYLIESFQSFKSEWITIELRDDLTAIVIRSETGFDLIMPMRV